MLADMRAAVDAARLLTWRAAWMARQGKPLASAEGSMSKLVAGETAVRVTEQAIQILGGNGYTRDYPVPVRVRAVAVSAGTTVTVTGLRRMPADIAVRSVCSLGRGVPGNRRKLTVRKT